MYVELTREGESITGVGLGILEVEGHPPVGEIGKSILGEAWLGDVDVLSVESVCG